MTQQSRLKGRSGSVSVGSPGVHKVLFEPSKCFWPVWDFILNVISPLLPSSWGSSFALVCGVSFFLVGSNILLSMVVQQQVVISEFLQEKMSVCPSTLPS